MMFPVCSYDIFFEQEVTEETEELRAQGVCLAGLFLDRACSRDEFHGFFAIIPVIIEGVVEG
ncbi:MAG: hypothetical protein ACK57I_05540, partial [Akkermansiaceae bacterium]